MAIDFGYVLETIVRIAPRVPYTILIIIMSGGLGILLAMGVAAIRIKKWPVIHPITNLYLSFFRSTPGIIHIFLIYYGLPYVLKSIGINADEWDKMLYAIIALILFNGAYLSEFLRPAYLAVGKGQHDAANSIGMSGFVKFRRIILPQLLPIAWPNLENATVELVKDTSVLFVIGLVDIMGKARIILHNDYGVRKLEVYIATAVIYWIVTFLVSKGFQFAAKRIGIAPTSGSR